MNEWSVAPLRGAQVRDVCAVRLGVEGRWIGVRVRVRVRIRLRVRAFHGSRSKSDRERERENVSVDGCCVKSSPLLNGLRISYRAHRNNFLNSFSIAYVFGQIHTVSSERQSERE